MRTMNLTLNYRRVLSNLFLEFYLRSLFTSFLCFKICFLIEAEHSCKDILRETADIGIISLGSIIEVFACYIDTVFGSFQLSLKFQEVLVSFQVRIILGDS